MVAVVVVGGDGGSCNGGGVMVVWWGDFINGILTIFIFLLMSADRSYNSLNSSYLLSNC